MSDENEPVKKTTPLSLLRRSAAAYIGNLPALLRWALPVLIPLLIIEVLSVSELPVDPGSWFANTRNEFLRFRARPIWTILNSTIGIVINVWYGLAAMRIIGSFPKIRDLKDQGISNPYPLPARLFWTAFRAHLLLVLIFIGIAIIPGIAYGWLLSTGNIPGTLLVRVIGPAYITLSLFFAAFTSMCVIFLYAMVIEGETTGRKALARLWAMRSREIWTPLVAFILLNLMMYLLPIIANLLRNLITGDQLRGQLFLNFLTYRGQAGVVAVTMNIMLRSLLPILGLLSYTWLRRDSSLIKSEELEKAWNAASRADAEELE
jgi:hypothetical protein